MSLKDGNEDLRSFIYSLSHDLRSPLVNIKGFSGELAHLLKDLAALLDRASERLTPEDRLRLEAMLQNEIPATLGFIGGAAERINELVNAVRKLSLVGQMVLKPETIDMDTFVRTGLPRTFFRRDRKEEHHRDRRRSPPGRGRQGRYGRDRRQPS